MGGPFNWSWFSLPAQIALGIVGADVIRWLAHLVAVAVGR